MTGLGTKAVLPSNIAQMAACGRPVAGKWPAILKDGRVYVHRFHLEANKMANGGVIGPEDGNGFVEPDAAGTVIATSW